MYLYGFLVLGEIKSTDIGYVFRANMPFIIYSAHILLTLLKCISHNGFAIKEMMSGLRC